MGADSMTTIPTTPNWTTYANARKLFQIRRLPIAVMTFGLGSVARRSVGSLVEEWAMQKVIDPASYTVEEVARSLCTWFFEKHRGWLAEIESKFTEAKAQDASLPDFNPKAWQTGLIIGGYQPGNMFPFLYSEIQPIASDSDKFACVRPHDGDKGPPAGPNWWGITESMWRLVRGFDPALMDALRSAGKISAEPKEIVSHATPFAWQIAFEGMPIKDAADLCEFLLQVGCGYDRFRVGATRVGGELDIAIVHAAGLHWYRRKTLFAEMESGASS